MKRHGLVFLCVGKEVGLFVPPKAGAEVGFGGLGEVIGLAVVGVEEGTRLGESDASTDGESESNTEGTDE